mmetsp:Transcript_29704/g.68789  ORF Transcript_29704/g.68789 Transcript_29704/m.68789 type:complete len:410 (-) Transcript_29704:72-1301(-)
MFFWKKNKKKTKSKEEKAPSTVFGVPLDEAARRSDPRALIPLPVRSAIDWLSHKFPENIYRAEGCSSVVQEYVSGFNNGTLIAFRDSEAPENVAATLMHYFSCLPDPLLSPDMRSLPDPAHNLPVLSSLVAMLSPSSRATIKMFFHHLHELATHAAITHMDASALASVLFPSQKSLGELLITQAHEVFGPPTRLFGEPLAVAASRSDPNGLIPSPLSVCLQWLDRRGLRDQGLYRTSGARSRVSAYQAMFDEGETVVIPDHEAPSTVASLVSRFLRELPQPLFGSSIQQAFMQSVGKDDAERCAILRAALQRLSPAHLASLAALAFHLNRVVFEEENLMTAKNLAICLYGHAAGAFEYLVLNAHRLFDAPPGAAAGAQVAAVNAAAAAVGGASAVATYPPDRYGRGLLV